MRQQYIQHPISRPSRDAFTLCSKRGDGSPGKGLVMGFDQFTILNILIFLVLTNNVKAINAKQIDDVSTNLRLHILAFPIRELCFLISFFITKNWFCEKNQQCTKIAHYFVRYSTQRPGSKINGSYHACTFLQCKSLIWYYLAFNVLTTTNFRGEISHPSVLSPYC